MKNPLNRHSEPATHQPADNNSRESARESTSGVFRNFAQRLRSPTSPKPTATVFQRVHHPDRPPVPVLPTDIPSEDECRFLLKHYLDSPVEQTARSPGFETIIKQEVSERRADRETKTAMESQKQQQKVQQKVQRAGSVVAGPPRKKTSVGTSGATASTAASTQRSTRPPTSKSSATSAAAQGAPRPLRRVPNLANVSRGSSRSPREAASQVATARPSVRPARGTSSSSSANSTRRQLPPRNEAYASPRPAPKPPAMIPFSERVATLTAAGDQSSVRGRIWGPVPVTVSIPRRTSSTGAVKKQTEGEKREGEKRTSGEKTNVAGEKARQQYDSHQSRRMAWSPLEASVRFERLGDRTGSSTTSEQDAAVAAAIAEAEAGSGEPLLEWDIEVIKASLEGSRRREICRQRSAVANNEAPAAGPTCSPSTKPTRTATARMSATACLLQCLTNVPPEVAARVGIVTVGVAAQPSSVRIEQAATRTSIALSGSSDNADDVDDEIRSQHGEVLEGWPGSEYYFEGGDRR